MFSFLALLKKGTLKRIHLHVFGKCEQSESPQYEATCMLSPRLSPTRRPACRAGAGPRRRALTHQVPQLDSSGDGRGIARVLVLLRLLVLLLPLLVLLGRRFLWPERRLQPVV